MSEYNQFPAVDANYNFPPEIREAFAASDEIAEAIGADPTVVAAAAAAVNANPTIAGLDDRIDDLEVTAPKLNADKGFRVTDKAGYVALGVDPTDGTALLGNARFEALSDNHPSIQRVKDKNGAVILDIRRDGNVFFGPREIHLFIAAGQSNMSGRGTPVGSDYDPIDQRILQYGVKAQSIKPATVPLDMHDVSTGLSPATVFAREYLKDQPPHVSVLLVPAAHGGCGFTTVSTTPPPTGYTYVAGGGCWQVTDQAGVNLYKDMLAQTQAAIAQSTLLFGSAPKIKGLLWHQGEADSARLTQSEYATYFDDLVTSLRTAIAAPNMAVIVGEMSPDWTARNTVAAGVMAAHIQTPARFEYAGFAYGVPNTGRHGDDVHYSREGIKRLGKNMYDAYDMRAMVNITGNPAPPPVVTATRNAGKLDIRWEQAPSRVTGYVVEYQVDGGSWITAPTPSPALDTKTSVTGVTGSVVLVRVSTVNSTATSAPTLPIMVIGV